MPMALPDVLCIKRDQPRAAGGADVSRQRLGHALRRRADRGRRWCCRAGIWTAPAWPTSCNAERVTFTCGVPTVWLGLLQHLRSSGERLETVKRIMTGGSAAPPLLIDAFRDEYGVAVEHGWGMTELSPVGTYNAPKAAQAGTDEGRGGPRIC